MTLQKKHLTVGEAQEYLELNGIDFSQVWIRTLIMTKKVKSKKVFSSRIIPRTELDKIIDDRKGREKQCR